MIEDIPHPENKICVGCKSKDIAYVHQTTSMRELNGAPYTETYYICKNCVCEYSRLSHVSSMSIRPFGQTEIQQWLHPIAKEIWGDKYAYFKW